VHLALSDGTTLEADHVVLAVGVEVWPNLHMGKAGIRVQCDTYILLC
jgi:pyruvate/2-oxoglutarate dehydrogenase complex dihydrolipoamide dehydrogenase (E3) component